jgi:hypothetical protein
MQIKVQFVSELSANLWFSQGTLISSTNIAASHDITEILLKMIVLIF